MQNLAGWPSKRLTPEIPLLHPSALDVGQHVAKDHSDAWEDLGQSMHPELPSVVTSKHDPLLGDAVVDQDLDRHQSRASAGHLRVDEKNALALLKSLRQLQIVQFRLAGANVGLDKDPSGAAVWDESMQGRFEGGTTAQHQYCGDFTIGFQAIVSVPRWGLNGRRREADVVKGPSFVSVVLDEQDTVDSLLDQE